MPPRPELQEGGGEVNKEDLFCYGYHEIQEAEDYSSLVPMDLLTGLLVGSFGESELGIPELPVLTNEDLVCWLEPVDELVIEPTNRKEKLDHTPLHSNADVTDRRQDFRDVGLLESVVSKDHSARSIKNKSGCSQNKKKRITTTRRHSRKDKNFDANNNQIEKSFSSSNGLRIKSESDRCNWCQRFFLYSNPERKSKHLRMCIRISLRDSSNFKTMVAD